MHNRRVRSMNLGVCSQSWKFYDAKFNDIKLITKINRKKLPETDAHHNLECLQELDNMQVKPLLKSTISSGGTDKPLKLGNVTARTSLHLLKKGTPKSNNGSIKGSDKYKPFHKVIVKKLNMFKGKRNTVSRQSNAIVGMSEVTNKESEFILPRMDDTNELKGRYVKLLSKRTVGESLPVIKPILRGDLGMYTKESLSTNYLKKITQRKYTINSNSDYNPSLQGETSRPSKRKNDAIAELCRSIDHILAGGTLVPL